MTNDVIFETVVSTLAADGRPHVAPMGVRYRGEQVVLMPFKPSTTHDNIVATGFAVLNILTDTRVFAGSVTGRREWPLLPAERVTGVRLACALRHVELRLAARADDAQRPRLSTDDAQRPALNTDDAQRPTLHMSRVHEVNHAAFVGFNRAQAAVIEGAVLVSRLRMLPQQKVDAEMAYLQIAIDKTAGPEEREAWGWLLDAVRRHRADSSTATAVTAATAATDATSIRPLTDLTRAPSP